MKSDDPPERDVAVLSFNLFRDVVFWGSHI